MQYSFGAYIFDPAQYELRHMGQSVALRPQACELLAYLLQHRDRVVPKEELLAQVWPGQYVGDGVLHACVLAVRTALHDTGRSPSLLHTVRGRGYRFVTPVEVHNLLALDDPTQPRHVLNGEVLTPVLPSPLSPDIPNLPPEVLRLHTDGEYKPVTALCYRLVDVPSLMAWMGLEGYYALLQTMVRLTQEVIRPYDGTLMPPMSESLIVLFGAPVAQEDHARRAVLATLELRQRIHDIPALRAYRIGDIPTLGMGLHSGLVVVGDLGQDPQQNVTAVGVPLHLAMRLQQQAAPGAILLSAATYALVRTEVRAVPYGTLTMDGVSAPEPIYAVQELLRRQAGVTGRVPRLGSPFVGRERELMLLHDHLAAAMRGQGQVVGLVGEPGIGKTRLLTEFCHRVSGNQMTVYEGRCLSYGQAAPYLLMRDLVRQMCALVEGDMSATHTAAVQHRLHASGITMESDVALLLQLLDLLVHPACLAPYSPETQRARTFALLRHLILHTAQQQPLVLMVENLHWIDPTSDAWLGSLIERLAEAPVLLLATYRRGYQPTWSARSAMTQIALTPLHTQDSRTVVRSVLGSGVLPEAWLRTVVARAEGNPFFLEELAWHAAERDGLDIAGVVPETVQAVLAARMDRLSSEAKRLLQTAAVMGPEVPLSLLQIIADVPEEAMHRGLAHLQAAEFFYERRLFPDHVYTFQHALTHEVAYNSLLQERRRALHVRLVETLEGLAGGRLAEQVERLAHHALRGELWDKALLYSRRAGHQAAAHSAYREAVMYMEQALEILSHLPESRIRCEQAIDLRLDLRFALWRLGEWEQVLNYLHEAEGLAESLGDQYRLAQISYNIADSYRIRGGYERARLAAHHAYSLDEALGDRSLQIETHAIMGQIHYHLGDYGRAIELLQQTITDLASEHTPNQDHTPDSLLVWQQSWLLLCLAQRGAFQAGQTISLDVLRMAEASNYPFNLIVAAYGVGILFLRQGELLQAMSILEQGLALCHASEIKDWLPTLAAGVGYAYALADRLPEALPLLAQAVEQYSAMRGGTLYPAVMVMQGEATLIAGRIEDATAICRRALDLARHSKERGSEAYALCLLGEIAARSEPLESAQAETYYRQALTLADTLGMRPLVAHCHLGLGRLYVRMDQPEPARLALSTATTLYREMDMGYWLLQAEAARVQVAEQ